MLTHLCLSRWPDFIFLGQMNLLAWFFQKKPMTPWLSLSSNFDPGSVWVGLQLLIASPGIFVSPKVSAQNTVSGQHVLGCRMTRWAQWLEQTGAAIAVITAAFIYKHLALQGTGVKDTFSIVENIDLLYRCHHGVLLFRELRNMWSLVIFHEFVHSAKLGLPT